MTVLYQAQAPPVPKKARPMPDQAELRRQMLAYKQQVHELRIQYAKELEAKANKADERKRAAASVSARGIHVLHTTCRLMAAAAQQRLC
jgi:hypothetical protein